MGDPLSALRHYILNKGKIIAKGDHVIFGKLSWPKDVKTNYIDWRSKEHGFQKDYYTLECIIFFLKNVHLPHPQYTKLATSKSIPFVRRPDRKDLLEYMKGDKATSGNIDKLAAIPPPTRVKWPAVVNIKNENSSKVRIQDVHILRVNDHSVPLKLRKNEKTLMSKETTSTSVFKVNNNVIKASPLLSNVKKHPEDKAKSENVLEVQIQETGHICYARREDEKFNERKNALAYKEEMKSICDVLSKEKIEDIKGKRIANKAATFVTTTSASSVAFGERQWYSNSQAVSLLGGDPLKFLRQYHINKVPIAERDGYIQFGKYLWPKDTPTSYTTWGTMSSGREKQYYTLECLLFLIRNANLPHPQYVRQATALNIPSIRRPDRKNILAYLNGEITTSLSIDKKALVEIPLLLRNCEIDSSSAKYFQKVLSHCEQNMNQLSGVQDTSGEIQKIAKMLPCTTSLITNATSELAQQISGGNAFGLQDKANMRLLTGNSHLNEDIGFGIVEAVAGMSSNHWQNRAKILKTTVVETYADLII